MRLDTDQPGGPNGSGDRFLAFLKDEMIPTVEREYRTQRPRMLAGWSRGGLFVVYSLLAVPNFLMLDLPTAPHCGVRTTGSWPSWTTSPRHPRRPGDFSF